MAIALPPSGGATVVYKTMKTVGGDYTSMSNLEAANADLVAANEAWVVTCDNFHDNAAGTVTWGGWTTDATRWLYVRAADVHTSRGALSATAYRHTSIGGACMNFTTIGAGGAMYFEGIQFYESNTLTSCITPGNGGAAGQNLYFINCVIQSAAVAGMGFYYSSSSNRAKATFVNCILIGQNNHAFHNSAGVACDFYNCTLAGSVSGGTGRGIYTNAAKANVIKNCYIHGAGGSFNNPQQAGSTIVTTATSDALGTPVGLQNVPYNNATFTNTAVGAEDLRPNGGTALLDAGTALAGIGYTYDYDLNQLFRDPAMPDVGAIERDPFVVSIHNIWDDVQIEEADWNSAKYASSIMAKSTSAVSSGYVRQNLAPGDDSSDAPQLTTRRVRNYYTIPPYTEWMYYRASLDGTANYYAVREDGMRYYERLYKDGRDIDLHGPCLIQGSLIPIAFCHPLEPKAAEYVEFSDAVYMNNFWCKLRWTPWHSFASVQSDMELVRFYIDATNYIALTQLASESYQREHNIADVYSLHEPIFQLKKVRAGGTEETCQVTIYYGYTNSGTGQDWIVHDTIEFDIYHIANVVMGMNVSKAGLNGYATAADSGVVGFSGTAGTIKLSGYGFHAAPEVRQTVESDDFRMQAPARKFLPTGRPDLMRRLQTPVQSPVMCGERDPTHGLINNENFTMPYEPDDFDRADDPNLGDKWNIVKQTGNGWNIVSNKAQCTQMGWEYYDGIPGHADLIVSAKATVSNNGDVVGIGTRFVRTTISDVTCYGAEIVQVGAAAATLRLVLWFEGVRTVLNSDAFSAYTQGTEYLLKITTLGTTITAEALNLAGTVSYASTTDTNDILRKAGRVAIYGETGGATQAVTLDDFTVTRNFTYDVS